VRLHRDRSGSVYNRLTRGCELCAMGAKLVLFAGGRCGRDCWYCPVSEERRGESAYANERILKIDGDLLSEAADQGALGTGVTGGEPLLYLGRVEKYVGLLKRTLGDEHHVHLYTGMAPTAAQLKRLKKSGIDELRLHPPIGEWGRFPNTPYARSLLDARNLGMDAGLEVPALQPVPEAVEFLEEHGGFIILDELEFSDTNAVALKREGYRLCADSMTAAGGSAQAGYEIVARANCRARFCSSVFKDGVQLRQRFRRTAARVRRPYQKVTRDGLLVYGVLHGDGMKERVMEKVKPQNYRCLNDGAVEVSVSVARRVKRELGGKCEASIVSRHPVAGGMVVEKTFL